MHTSCIYFEYCADSEVSSPSLLPFPNSREDPSSSISTPLPPASVVRRCSLRSCGLRGLRAERSFLDTLLLFGDRSLVLPFNFRFAVWSSSFIMAIMPLRDVARERRVSFSSCSYSLAPSCVVLGNAHATSSRFHWRALSSLVSFSDPGPLSDELSKMAGEAGDEGVTAGVHVSTGCIA